MKIDEESKSSLAVTDADESTNESHEMECLLMTSTDHYLTHIATFETISQSKMPCLVLRRKKEDDLKVRKARKPIVYDLRKVHATSMDQDNRRNSCKIGSFYTLCLQDERCRKLYFLEYDEME